MIAAAIQHFRVSKARKVSLVSQDSREILGSWYVDYYNMCFSVIVR